MPRHKTATTCKSLHLPSDLQFVWLCCGSLCVCHMSETEASGLCAEHGLVLYICRLSAKNSVHCHKVCAVQQTLNAWCFGENGDDSSQRETCFAHVPGLVARLHRLCWLAICAKTQGPIVSLQQQCACKWWIVSCQKNNHQLPESPAPLCIRIPLLCICPPD